MTEVRLTWLDLALRTSRPGDWSGHTAEDPIRDGDPDLGAGRATRPAPSGAAQPVTSPPVLALLGSWVAPIRY